MVKTEDLVKRGYFPKELIPAFSTEKLAEALPEIEKSDLKSIINDKKYTSSKCCLYSIPKVKHARRLLGIPNPLHQIILCQTLEDNWLSLEAFFLKSKLSLSTPKISKISDRRAVTPAFALKQLPVERVLRSTSSRILLHADVSRYYSTIYTHTIPWALHTKIRAKADRSERLCGNVIDKCVRNTQDKQTLGIPTGPDTSLIISEIIGTAMDIMLSNELSDIKLNGYRYIDDYYLFFSNWAQAEQATSKIHSIAKHFELELNPNKVELIELPESLNEPWVSELRTYNFRKTNETAQKNDILNYFDKSYKYSKQYPNNSVLKYSIKRIVDLDIKPINWPLYESFLLKSAVLEPNVLPNVIDILVKYSKKKYLLDFTKISDTIADVIIYHSELKHSYEVSWAMWLSKILHIEISENAARSVSNFEDSIVALTALDLKNSGQIPKGLNTSKWEALMTAEELYSDHWLLSYEAGVKGWLPTIDGDYISEDPFFSTLKNAGVEFYNTHVSDKTDILDTEPEISHFDVSEYDAWLGIG